MLFTSMNTFKIFSLHLKNFPCVTAKFPVFSLSGKSKKQIPFSLFSLCCGHPGEMRSKEGGGQTRSGEGGTPPLFLAGRYPILGPDGYPVLPPSSFPWQKLGPQVKLGYPLVELEYPQAELAHHWQNRGTPSRIGVNPQPLGRIGEPLRPRRTGVPPILPGELG